MIAEQNGIAVYDALIVASALQADCSELLLTDDLQHGRVIDGRLTFGHPFVAV